MKTGVLALVLVGLFASTASAIDFHVNSFNDRADANPGDRRCATAAPVECTLRAAIQEALVTRCLSIAGGTTQVLRNVAAERTLGLPRD